MYSIYSNMLRLKQYHRDSFAHCVRVGQIAALLCREYALSANFVCASYLHDYGKLFIPVQILDKAGKLSDSERKVIELHPVFGAVALAEQQLYCSEIISLVLNHHTNYNGKGYPTGLYCHSFETNLISIIDMFDALTSKRAYHAPISSDKALTIIQECSGDKFAPESVDIFTDFASCHSFPTVSDCLNQFSLGDLRYDFHK